MKINHSLSLLIYIPLFFSFTECKKKPELPEITTSEISDIRLNSATGGGTITFDGNSEITSRGVSFTPFVSVTPSDRTTLDGSGTGSFQSQLTGLRPGTVYYVRAYATNAAGTQYGAPVSFTTGGTAPEIKINDSEFTATTTSATLHGHVNSMGLTTIVSFYYGKSYPFILSAEATQNPLTVKASVGVSATITGLTPFTTYFYMVNASNELGTTSSNIYSFATQGWPPTIRSFSLTDITRNSVNVRSVINPGLLLTTTSIEFGLTKNYGSSVSYPQNPLNGGSDIVIENVIDNLEPGTKYYFRIKTVNEAGTNLGNELYCVTNN